MCVIIVKDPGVELPYDKLESACWVNSDGYGISVIDRGKIETKKVFDPKGNDPAAVAKLLEESKDLKTILHLRFRTAGEKAEEACHPFHILTKEQDDLDMLLMHNGTMRTFEKKGSVEPDSYHFVQEIVRPLATRFGAAMTNEEIIEDPLFQRILSDYAGLSNKLVIYDNNGKVLIINKDQGKQYEGWWASNEYSFNRSHRGNGFGPTTSSGVWAEGYQGATSSPYRPATTGASNTSGTGASSPRVLPASGSNTDAGKSSSVVCLPTKEGREVAGVIKANTVTPASSVIHPPAKRETFVEITGLNNLSEAAVLEEDDIKDLVKELPDVATLLIMDLLYQLYLSTNKKAA